MKAQRLLQVVAVAGLFGAIALLPLACGNDGPAGPCSHNGNACTLICSSDFGCAECGGDGDCGAAAPFCVTGHCEECASPGDCGASLACYPRDNKCHPICTSNGQCTDGDAKICDLDTGACVGCITSADCSGTHPICNPYHGQCDQCGANGDCGAAAPFCDLNDGECKQCIVDGDCDAGLCDDGHCKAGCQGDGDCPAERPFCSPNFQCVECAGNGDCPTTRPFCNNELRCAQCVVAADCNPFPTTPFCDGLSCVQCIEGKDCADGLKCKDHVCQN